MIVVDTSAIMAMLLREPEAEACIAAVEAADALLVSAATLAETLIVAGRRAIAAEAIRLVDGLGIEIVPVGAGLARRVAEAYARWGKGVHPAGLNFGDCFAYALAQERGCALLYVGRDFAQTDIASAA